MSESKNKVLLKVDEWKSSSKHWFVADVHTWTGWRAMAEVLDIEQDIDKFKELLLNKYNATVESYRADKDFLMFYWPESDYKNAHQFKLDVNRLARKKNYLI